MFPTELVTKVIKDVDTRPDLLNLRLVCRQFRPLATPSTFRHIQVRSTVTGAKNLAQLQESDLADFVHELEFTHETENEETNASLVKAFSALPQFAKLEKLVFKFCPYYNLSEGEDATELPPYSASSQHALIGALINSPLPPLVSTLSLVNMAAHYDELFEKASFRQLMQKLKSFSLSTHTNPKAEDYQYLQEPSYDDFLEKNVCNHIMTPSTSLVSLSIKNDRMTVLFAWDRPQQPKKPLFPNLAHLTLRDILFSEGMKEFVHSHSASLTHLELDDCRMGDEDMPLRPTNTWKRFFSRVQQKMEHLVSFCFTHSSGLNVSPSGDYFISTSEYDGWVLDSDTDKDYEEEIKGIFKQDKSALDSLEAATKLRASIVVE